MTTKLTLFNGALRELGERRLASLTENTATRRELDGVWDEGAVDHCLEQGHWKFAQRTAKLTYASTFTPSFGYNRQFEKPTDYVKLSKMCTDEFLNQPLLQYADEAGFWFAEEDEIYVSYVSNHASFGGDMTLWPQTFVLYFELYLATRIARRITQSATAADELNKDMRKKLVDARSKDAMAGPTTFPPTGSWNNSRNYGSSGSTRRDRGSRSRLIG